MMRVVGPQVVRGGGRLFGGQIWMALAGALLALILGGRASPAYAQTIEVDSGAVGINSGDGCSLTEAIINANNDAATEAECAAGSGADVIVLDGGVYHYEVEFADQAALPAISSVMTIEGNGATLEGSGGLGPGLGLFRLLLVTADGNLTLNDLTITRGNTGSSSVVSYAGGLDNDGGTLTINHSTIVDNDSFYGGGVVNRQGTLTINQSTISGNNAGSGGGVYNMDNGTVIINNSTIAYNEAFQSGGGVYIDSGVATFNRTIVSGNMGGGNSDVTPVSGSTVHVDSHNLFGTGGDGSGLDFLGITLGDTDIDARLTLPEDILDPLNDNGGLTRTHALGAGSLAVDHVPTGLSGTHDQRGAVRDYNGMSDVGAVELRDRRTQCFDQPEGKRLLLFRFGDNSRPMFIDAQDGSIGDVGCVTVEEMGPGVDHPAATDPLQTGNWWHISANVESGFNVEVGLPFAGADAGTRVCKFPGNLGGAGWDCGTEVDHDVVNDSVVRTGVNSFSDWAVGQNAEPTAVQMTQRQAGQAAPGYFAWAALGLLLVGLTLRVWRG